MNHFLLSVISILVVSRVIGEIESSEGQFIVLNAYFQLVGCSGYVRIMQLQELFWSFFFSMKYNYPKLTNI